MTSYRRTNEPSPLEAEPSTAGATGAGDLEESLHMAIEVVLLDQAGDLINGTADPNVGELAYCYELLTGWTVCKELEG